MTFTDHVLWYHITECTLSRVEKLITVNMFDRIVDEGADKK